MARPGSVIGWKLDREQRGELLERFPPRYSDTIADHVTLKTNAAKNPLPSNVIAEIVGRADDGDSLECLVVSVDGSVDRPDGSIFHITWSLDKADGREARESNVVLKERGWEPLHSPVPLKLDPARFP
jgi:hypothetical protein